MTQKTKKIRLLVAVTNHKLNKQAIALKQAFQPYADTILIDNDSPFESAEEKMAFDYCLTDAYYSGQINKAYEHMTDEHTHLVIINSDVTVPNPEGLVKRAQDVFEADPHVGIYAPSANYSPHNHMANRNSGGVRKVTFTDGFCFIIPKESLQEICPIDLSINKIGHGIEMYLAFLDMKRRNYTVVDDLVEVQHPQGSGYSSQAARKMRDDYYATKSKAARVFHYWVSKDILKNKIGYQLVYLLMRRYI